MNTTTITTISATDIAKVLLERPYIVLKKSGKQIYALDVASIDSEGNGYDLLHGSGKLTSVDGVYELINIVRTSSVSAKELKKANRRYRTFDKKGMNNTVIGVDRPMDIALNKAGMTEDDIISVNLSDIYAKALASKNSKRAMENVKTINIAVNTYGIRLYDEKLYVALSGWVTGSTVVELYDVEMKKTYLDAETNKGLSLSKTFMPSVRTSSMKNAGEKFFILDNKIEDFERALCCGLSLRDRFNQLSNNGLLSVSTKQMVKEWKYLPSSIAGRTKLDLSKCRIAVIDQKGRVGDGNGSANPNLVGVANKTALQMRVRTYQGKGMLMCEEETFARDLKYLNKVAAVHPEMITYYGNPSLTVGIIVDRNFIKMLDERLEVVPEDERTSWIIHEFGELSRSEMSIDECSKWLRRCANDEDRKLIMDMFIRGFERGLKKKTLACFTPDTEGNYLPSMLKGVDKWSTIKSLDSMFGKLWSADCRPTAWMGGYTLGLTQHPVFKDAGAAYRKARGKDGLAVVFVNTETWKKVGMPTEAVLTKFPSPSERGAVRVAVRINDHACDNCIGLDMSKESMALLEAMSGADCDGDKANFMATVIEKNGENIRTWLGKILENAGYRHMTVKNILPEMAETATVDSVLEMHIKDISSQAGMTGVMVSAMNIIKLNAKGNPDAEAYVGRFGNIAEMRMEDILSWMEYIGQNGCNVKIDDTNRAAWWLDCGLIQDWLAEFTTGLSGSGVPMPDNIRNFFCAFKDSIVTYWVTSIEEANKAALEYNKTAEEGKKKSLIKLNKDKLVRRLTIANSDLYTKVETVISECDQWAHKRITEIKWVSDNAVSLAEFRKDHPKMAVEDIDVRFGYVGNYMLDKYTRYGFGHISAASHNLGNSDVWKHWAGTFAAAQDYRRTKKETNGEYTVRLLRVAELCSAAWNKSKYSTMFMVSRYVRKIGYNVTDEVALSYEKEYEGKYALPIVLMNSDKKNDYTATLAEIKSGNIVTGTIKGDRFVVSSTINGKNKNVGLQVATEADLLINGLNLHIDQLVNARIDDKNHKEYYVALCTIVD